MEELQSLVTLSKKGSITESIQLITVEIATRALARLGGFLGRKNDGEPGIISIWRGWNKVKNIAFAF